MIFSHASEVTDAVLQEFERAANPRFKEIMRAAVKHLHGFVRDARLTESEFQLACACIAKLGQMTTPSHNEVVLIAGSLGVSALVCLQNNSAAGEVETTASLLGPFWRPDSPSMPNGASIVRGPTPGEPIFVEGWVKDRQGRPVAGAEIDVWHTSAEGFYENQDPGQADMNLRGRFTTDENGCIRFRSVKPAGYPIPVHGPTGDMLRAAGRHNMRPAHVHFLIRKEGFKTQFAQVYLSDDPHLDSDCQFGVTHKLIGHYEKHVDRPAPADDVHGVWYSLRHEFVIDAGESRLPRAPINGKSDGERPVLAVLQRAE